jgi:D-sedoheptulose 7-phosphate isomerase
MSDSKFIEERVAEIRSLAIQKDSFPVNQLVEISRKISALVQTAGRVAFVGNGGSAAEAMHIAAEFTGKCVVDHPPLPVMCLNESQSSLTAIANDYGVDFVFSRMVEAHLRPGDLLVCLSTSGKSKNILEALDVANKNGIQTCLWMGDFDLDIPNVEVLKVPSKSTPRIQEIHLAWGHLISELVEDFWAKPKN